MSLDKSLEEIIAENKITGDGGRRRGGGGGGGRGRGGGRGGRGGGGGGGGRRSAGGPSRPRRQPAPQLWAEEEEYIDDFAPPLWDEAPVRAAPYPTRAARSAPSGGAVVSISGLAEDWDIEDVKEIFEEVGFPVQTVTMKWDRSGRSAGGADVSFSSAQLADRVVNDLDGAEVDGYIINCELAAPRRGGVAQARRAAVQQRAPRQAPVRSMGGGRPRGGAGGVRGGSRGGRGGGGGGGGGGRGARGGNRDGGRKKNMTEDELDAQLAGYGGESASAPSKPAGGGGGRGGGGRRGGRKGDKPEVSAEDLDAQLAGYGGGGGDEEAPMDE